MNRLMAGNYEWKQAENAIPLRTVVGKASWILCQPTATEKRTSQQTEKEDLQSAKFWQVAWKQSTAWDGSRPPRSLNVANLEVLFVLQDTCLISIKEFLDLLETCKRKATIPIKQKPWAITREEFNARGLESTYHRVCYPSPQLPRTAISETPK